MFTSPTDRELCACVETHAYVGDEGRHGNPAFLEGTDLIANEDCRVSRDEQDIGIIRSLLGKCREVSCCPFETGKCLPLSKGSLLRVDGWENSCWIQAKIFKNGHISTIDQLAR